MLKHSPTYMLFKKSSIDIKTSRKKIENFIELYLMVCLLKGHSIRSGWDVDTRYLLNADVMTRNRFLLLTRNIHLVNNDDKL